MKKPIIFILDDDKEVLNMLEEFLSKNTIESDVYKFTKIDKMMNHKSFKYVDLFILDIRLGTKKTGKDVCTDILNLRKYSTCLFVSGVDYSFDSFSDLDCTFDFIKKPFSLGVFNNRVKTLLRLSKEYRRFEKTKIKISLSLIDLFDYSDLYIILLDETFSVRLCSHMLAKDLGFDSSEELVGRNWSDFLPSEMNKLKNLFSNKKNRISQEFTNDIITRTKKRISTKWFNTRVENGIIWTFSIGIPLTKTISKEDSIETMRSYWEDIIQKDRTTINIFKEITMNNTDRN
jgi:DNA-binding response OmpR family regulator